MLEPSSNFLEISWLLTEPARQHEAIAAMGGTAGQLSNGLWQARGDEFSVEKADFGYMAGEPWGGMILNHYAYDSCMVDSSLDL